MREQLTIPVQIRESDEGQILSGVILAEGRAATGGRRELFVPGSVTWPVEGMDLLIRHGGPRAVRVTPSRGDAGEIVFSTPATPQLREAVEGGLSGLSVEFLPLAERTTKAGVREILRAFVPSAALVDHPEYEQAHAEIRDQNPVQVFLL